MKSLISCVEPLSFPYKCLDPFLFCVYHKDLYPAGNDKMEAPRKGNGADFNPNSAYRMYHGDYIPGFPQHPHRGFETITATLEGIIDHTDSMGNAGRYGHGDLQWMTAGKGIVHSEMFPLINNTTATTITQSARVTTMNEGGETVVRASHSAANPTKFFQIWLNLPSASKMVEPAFKMHWSEEIPRYTTVDGLATVIIWAGVYEGIQGLSPPPNSWAAVSSSASSSNDIGIWHITLHPGGKITIPGCVSHQTSSHPVNRMAYFVEGTHLSITGGEGGSNQQSRGVATRSAITLDAKQDVLFENNCPIELNTITEILILQGKPINEPVVQHGPFVMNTKEEINQAFHEYRLTQFGGWPWKGDNAVVFPREKSRFALINGIETYPPTVISSSTK